MIRHSFCGKGFRFWGSERVFSGGSTFLKGLESDFVGCGRNLHGDHFAAGFETFDAIKLAAIREISSIDPEHAHMRDQNAVRRARFSDHGHKNTDAWVARSAAAWTAQADAKFVFALFDLHRSFLDFRQSCKRRHQCVRVFQVVATFSREPSG